MHQGVDVIEAVRHYLDERPVDVSVVEPDPADQLPEPGQIAPDTPGWITDR